LSADLSNYFQNAITIRRRFTDWLQSTRSHLAWLRSYSATRSASEVNLFAIASILSILSAVFDSRIPYASPNFSRYSAIILPRCIPTESPIQNSICTSPSCHETSASKHCSLRRTIAFPQCFEPDPVCPVSWLPLSAFDRFSSAEYL
jgi:hypothetical protein